MAASAIQGVNVIVAVGSVDGMAATAACIHNLANPNIRIVFTQAFQVDKVDITTWSKESKVGFIDLAVNNEGEFPNKQLTIDFVKRIYLAGHSIIFIADEHNKKAWEEVLLECGHNKAELTIKPKDRAKYTSSCAILTKALGDSVDAHTKNLLKAGDLADQMIVDTPFGKIFDECTKSNMNDPKRRPYVVHHMAHNTEPDETIKGWMKEYEEIKVNHPKILDSGTNLGDGIIRYNGTIGFHNATAIFNLAYSKSSIVVLSGTTVFLENQAQTGVSIGTSDKNLDVLKIIQEAGIKAGGASFKANLALKDEKAAIEAIRKAVRK